MFSEACCHCRCPVVPITFDILLAECPNRPTEVVAKTDEKGCGIVQIPVLGEAISFAYLSCVLSSIRTIVSLNKRSIDRVTCHRNPKQIQQQSHCAEHDRTDHLNHSPFLSLLTYRGIAQIHRHDLFGLGGGLPGPVRLG